MQLVRESSHEWFGNAWGFAHPCSAHACQPLLQRSPGAASVQVPRLYPKQIGPFSHLAHFPFKTFGILGVCKGALGTSLAGGGVLGGWILLAQAFAAACFSFWIRRFLWP